MSILIESAKYTYDPEEIARVRKLWEDKLKPQPEEEPTPTVKEKPMKATNLPFEDCNTLEKSFRELVKDKPAGMNPSQYIKVLKDITAQSFNGKNMFRSCIFTQQERVKYLVEEVRCHYDSISWHKRFGGRGMYIPRLSGIAIPVNLSYNDLFHKARLVIATHRHLEYVQISLQFLMTDDSIWVDVPCRTNNVKEVIEQLLIQEA
ncbi:hypothetical protein D9_0241 [Aeromonas phage D9]|nr:hypothetical protein D9_0241 [Aeromonas phage D9]